MMRCGLVWCDAVLRGVAWCGVAWCGVVFLSLVSIFVTQVSYVV